MRGWTAGSTDGPDSKGFTKVPESARSAGLGEFAELMASNNSGGTSEQLSTCVLTAPSQLGLGSVSDSKSLSRNLRRRLLVGPRWAASPTGGIN